jgi:hypothetical protein
MAEVPITYEGFASPFLEDRYDRFGAPIIKDIDETTMDAVIEMINEGLRRGYSPLQIANGVEDEDFDGVASVFDDDARSEMIARTETMFALNWGSGSSFADSGVSHVEAMDGSDDPECAARDGQIYEIDPDTGVVVDETGEPVKDHPNGTLAFAPYITDDVVAGGALDDTGEVVSFEDELGAVYEVKHGTGQTNNPHGGNQHGAGAKVPRKHSHRNGVTHRHIGGARPHQHGGRVIPADSPAYRKEAPPGSPLAETKYSDDQPRDERGRFGEGDGSSLGGPGADTEAERSALTFYQGNGFDDINEYLRSGNLSTGRGSPLDEAHLNLREAGLKGWIKAIDSAMEPMPEGKTVYRAIGMSGSETLLGAPAPLGGAVSGLTNEEVEERLGALVGGTIEDKGFVSTTTDREVAGAKTNLAPIMFEISVPAGTKAVDFTRHSTLGDPAYKQEKEILLDRDQKFRVDGVIGPTSDYGTTFPVHVLKLSVI